MAIASAGGGQSNAYSLPTVYLQAVGNALELNYSLNKRHLGGSVDAHDIGDNYSRVRLHNLQFFSAKFSAVDAKNSRQRGFW
ncbi:MAG: hypothetical protein V7K25_24640 [Nostoc sp.]|uniref:hypothetical protein n=1 Tax=Nostoc sp. TaxID=1180 RepID=UPI002FF88B5A